MKLRNPFRKRQPEPLFMALDDTDPEVLATVIQARATLSILRRALVQPRENSGIPLVKTRFDLAEGSLNLWLVALSEDGVAFQARVFEAPAGFTSLTPGQIVTIPASRITDWMINTDGVLEGGFSVRYQRSKVSPKQRTDFDRYVGVRVYGHAHEEARPEQGGA